jgi:hypothetical protein
MLPVFEELLAPYPTQRITGAFREWLKTESTLPTPADILKILNWEPYPKSPEIKEVEPVNPNDWKFLTQSQRDELDGIMNTIKTISGAPAASVQRGKVDFTHWNRTPEEYKATIPERVREALRNVRISHSHLKQQEAK